MTASILSFAFWVIGLPYFLLVGVFAGIVEILPVIGPLIAGLIAVAAGFDSLVATRSRRRDCRLWLAHRAGLCDQPTPLLRPGRSHASSGCPAGVSAVASSSAPGGFSS